MNATDLFSKIESTLLSKYNESAFISHQGDKGENREEVLRQFLSDHLPKRYGVTKGEILTKNGEHSHSADIIIYDALNCPILYSGKTNILPIEGVYGVIEVKSKLSKNELYDDADKIRKFKSLAPRDLSIVQTRNQTTLNSPSRPFGILVAYELRDTILEKISDAWIDKNREIYNVNNFINFIAILGEGMIYFEKISFDIGEKHPLIDTDEIVHLFEKIAYEKSKQSFSDSSDNPTMIRIEVNKLRDNTFGRFFVFLLIMLSRMKLNVPNIGQYFDADLPSIITRE